MPDSWTQALNAFSYPVDLRDYERAQEFPGFFCMRIDGNHASTIIFENHYQETAPHNAASFAEVVYWKLYTRNNIREKTTSRIINFVQNNGITAEQIWGVVCEFAELHTVENLRRIRDILGIKTNVISLPVTLIALASPETVPIIDKHVARWVNANAQPHNVNRNNRLIPFQMNYTSLRENDFPGYLHWVAWCREVAQVLTERTGNNWRARDIEMAVFTAQRMRLRLNPL